MILIVFPGTLTTGALAGIIVGAAGCVAIAAAAVVLLVHFRRKQRRQNGDSESGSEGRASTSDHSQETV